MSAKYFKGHSEIQVKAAGSEGGDHIPIFNIAKMDK